MLGRALIGLGVAAALMAGLKALVTWVPQERLALANGVYVMCGALGALAATMPADWLLGALGWRGLFLALALATLGAVCLLWLVTPADPAPERAAPGMSLPGLGDVLRDPRFWRVAPLSAGCIGTAFALQGLWAGPWLADVGGLDRNGVISDLTLMALALCLGALALGVITDRLRRIGLRPIYVLAAVATASMLAQAMLALRAPVPDLLPWLWIGATGAATVVSFASLAEIFPKELAGRANAALNLLHIGGAFLIQSGFGAVVDLWSKGQAGQYPPDAYGSALLLNLIPQALALLWFGLAAVRPPLSSRARTLG
jgi:predicted MFS family arabinose efflux permease